MEVQPDFRELLELLNDHKADYIIVGGYALAFHGSPSFTGDIDLFVNPNPDNAKKVLTALENFGFKSLGLKESDFTVLDNVIQLGVPPVRIDLLTSISGVNWEEVSSGKVAGEYGSVDVFYIGRNELITNKKASGRQKDLADLEALGE